MFFPMIYVWFFIYIIIISTNDAHCKRVFEKMYESVQGDMACFKRANGTHEIGCTSEFWGNVGVVHVVEDESDLSWFIHNASHPPYVLALVPEYFTEEVLTTAEKSGKLSGVVLLNSANFTIPVHFSGDQHCPNAESSMYKNTSYSDYCEKNPWNPDGTSLLLKSWNFPIFYIEEPESVENILLCYIEFNKPGGNGESREWPLCAIELQSNMFATTNSEVCLRRSQDMLSSPSRNFCEPLEDINVWGSIKPLSMVNEPEENSVIIVSAAADASSLFDNISPGADVAVSGLVTLLVTAKALYRFSEEMKESSKNVMFIIFEGEAWDYIGSSRMVYDMVNNQFPYNYIDDQADQMSKLNLSHIDSVIDLRQLGFVNNKGIKTAFIHTDPISNSNEDVVKETNHISELLIANGKKWSINVDKIRSDAPLPPSSLQSFLKARNVSGIVLSDHSTSFKNLYYQSIFDDYKNLNYTSSSNSIDNSDQLHKDLTDIASILASTLFTMVTGRKKTITADYDITNELLYCYLKNTNCTYFWEHSDESLINFLYPRPAKMYVSVKTGENHLSYLTGRILSHFIGEQLNLNESDCTSNSTQIMNLDYFPYLDNGTCIQSAVHHSSALSPAFFIENYDWKSGIYSTWTESAWLKTEARIFLRPSPKEEIGLLVGGFLSLSISVLVVYFLNSQANTIFENEVLPAAC